LAFRLAQTNLATPTDFGLFFTYHKSKEYFVNKNHITFEFILWFCWTQRHFWK